MSIITSIFTQFSPKSLKYLLAALILTISSESVLAQSFSVFGEGTLIPSGQNEARTIDLTDMGSHDVNFGSKVTVFRLTNTSSTELTFKLDKIISLSGNDRNDFRILDQLPKTIPGGSSAFFNVVFDPRTPGLKTLTLSITADNNFSQGYWFKIQGRGVGEPNNGLAYTRGRFLLNKHLERANELVFFGDLAVNAEPNIRDIYITNFDTEPLQIPDSAYDLRGFAVDDFTLIKKTKSIIAPGETDIFSYSFTPSALGDRSVVILLNNGGESTRLIFSGYGKEDLPEPEEEEEPEPEGEVEPETELLDSDNDGVSDAQEALDASDPNDPSSFLDRLKPEFCFDWNGFLGMSFNIAEFSNLSANQIDISSSLYDTNLNFRDNKSLDILPGSQSDLLVHDMNGWSVDSFGTVCSRATSSNKTVEAGDIQGRMLKYRPNGLGGFDFVLSNEFSNPAAGSQFAQYNHFHPSYDPAEAGFFVANWFSIRNFEDSEQSGRIVIYDIDGSVLRIVPFTLSPKGLYDFGTHIVGANKVGIVEWRPDSSSALFRASLSRYYYGSSFGVGAEQISEAVSLPAHQGTSKMLVAPVDTREQNSILEIANTSPNAANVKVLVNDRQGNKVLDTTLPVAPRATAHLLIDNYLTNDLGVVFLENTFGGNVIANSIQYKRNQRAGLKSVFTVAARESLGSTLLGTYNTFLNQDCYLTLSNAKSSPEEIRLTLVKYNGQTLVQRQAFQVPGNGVLEINTCQFDSNNSYGTVKIETSRTGAITANMLRVGLNEEYRFATPVK